MDRGAWWATVHGVTKSWFVIVDLQCLLVSAVQKSDCYIYTYILFYILFHYVISQGIECSFLCYTVGSCLCIVYTIVCIH